MNILQLFALGIGGYCLAMPLACAQQFEEIADQPIVSSPAATTPSPTAVYWPAPAAGPGAFATLRPLGQRSHPTVAHAWVADLEKAGFYTRGVPTPYRVALPLVTFGERGPVLKLTYARNLPGSAGSSGPLLFIHIPTD